MFVVEQHQGALEYDQLPRRPITASVQTPDDINNVFYDQTDRKAAAFLRMLKCYTNDTIFEQSLVRFLKLYKYVLTFVYIFVIYNSYTIRLNLFAVALKTSFHFCYTNLDETIIICVFSVKTLL